MRRIHIIIALNILALSALAYFLLNADFSKNGLDIQQTDISPTVQGVAGVDLNKDFSATDHLGNPVTLQSYQQDNEGQFRIFYFGFTFCPDICPTELGIISDALNRLDEGRRDRIVPIFVSVDPERDTVEQMARYVAFFHPKMVGWTGSVEEIENLKRIFRVFARKIQTEEMSDYTVDHSSFVYLVNPQNELVTVFRMGTASDVMAALIMQAMAD